MSGITVGPDGQFSMTNVPEEMRAAMGANLAAIERERRLAGKPAWSRDRVDTQGNPGGTVPLADNQS